MKRTTNFSRIENVVYEFNEGDILRALTNFFNVVTGAGSKIEFNLWDSEFEPGGEARPNSGGAEIIVRYEIREPEDEEK